MGSFVTYFSCYVWCRALGWGQSSLVAGPSFSRFPKLGPVVSFQAARAVRMASTERTHLTLLMGQEREGDLSRRYR